MYDTPADSSRSSSCLRPDSPRALEPLSSRPWPAPPSASPLLSVARCFDSSSSRGLCPAALEHRPSDFQRRATLSSLFSRFCIHPDTPSALCPLPSALATCVHFASSLRTRLEMSLEGYLERASIFKRETDVSLCRYRNSVGLTLLY